MYSLQAVIPALNSLLYDVVIPPQVILTIRDTLPAQNPDKWLEAIVQLEHKMGAIKAQSSRVKATQEMEPIIDGLVRQALTHIPPFLLSLIRPLKNPSTGLSKNLAVMQTSVLLKYQPFYRFLLRHAPRTAKQVERGYVNAARAYYETAMRRYARALGQINARTVEKAELIGVVSSEAAAAVLNKTPPGVKQAYERLKYANLDIEGDQGAVILAYNVDDKNFRVPLEATFRSLMLVLVDNASAEFTFIVRFFAQCSSPKSPLPETPLDSPAASHMDAASEAGRSSRPRSRLGLTEVNEGLKDAERIWHQVFDTALESVSSFFNSILSPSPPPAIPLLTLIRLNDRLLSTCDSRGTLPLISYLQSQKLAMWPVYRKEMDQQVDSLKALADQAEGKGLASYVGKAVKDGSVRQVANRYGALFSCVTALSEEAEEAMMFSNMIRLRAELVRLAQAQAKKIKSQPEQHSFLSSIYEIILHELVSGPGPTTHPRLQSELSFFRTRDEEARRRIKP